MHEFGVVGEPKYIFFNILIQSNIPEQSGPVGTRIEQDGFFLLSTLNWMTLMSATWHFWVISESDPSDKNECHIFSEFELIGKKQGHMPTSNKNKRHMSKSAPQAKIFELFEQFTRVKWV